MISTRDQSAGHTRGPRPNPAARSLLEIIRPGCGTRRCDARRVRRWACTTTPLPDRTHGVTDLIDTTEMYLRTIFELEEEGITPLRARIAERLGHSGPTVSQTVARMERDGLLPSPATATSSSATTAGCSRRGSCASTASPSACSRRHRARVGVRPRRGVPLGARDVRAGRAQDPRDAARPRRVALRQPDPGARRARRPHRAGRLPLRPHHPRRWCATTPPASRSHAVGKPIQNDAVLMGALRRAGATPGATVKVVSPRRAACSWAAPASTPSSTASPPRRPPVTKG